MFSRLKKKQVSNGNSSNAIERNLSFLKHGHRVNSKIQKELI